MIAMRTIRREIAPLFEQAGVEPVFGNGAKHPFVEWVDRDGRSQRYIFSKTSSDWRALLNLKADLRRRLGGKP